MSTLGLSNDERAKLKHDMFPKFLEVRGKVAKWEGNQGKEQAKSALIHWKEAMFENCPKRAATDTEVSYITKQLVWIKDGLTVHVLQEEAHIIMATYLSILFQDITWFLSIDIKALFPPPHMLFLDMEHQTFDVEGTLPTQQQLSLQSREHVKGLGKMLALAFTVLWAAKTKVAEWGSESSTAKALLRSAIMELEMALDDVKNDEKVTLKKVRRLLKEVDQSHPGNIFVLQNLIVGLTRARITELMTMKSELDSAYASRRDKAGLQYVDPNETPLKQWMGLRTLLSDKK
ncbi:hypothetical protein H0H93_010745 [Arthromyces matolae]|nr:hypothetical protein H0H93_010745 [Arthromyces matolae]